MSLALLAIAALAFWMHTRGELLPALRRWGAVAVLALLAVRMLETGRWPLALVAAAGAAFWWYAARPRVGAASDVAGACRLLDVAPDADADTVHAAWRRALATAHPDAGGSNAAVQRLTAARDLLLARLEAR